MKKILSVLLAVMMIFGVVAVSFVGASAAEPVALKVTSTAYEIKVNQTVTFDQAKAYAESKFAEAQGVDSVNVIYAVGEALVTKEPVWKIARTYKLSSATLTSDITLSQSNLGYIIASIAAGKADYYVYGTTTIINPFLFQAVKVTDVNTMEVTTDITSSNMAVAVAYGLLSKELATATDSKPIYAVYAQSGERYSVIKSTSYEGTNIWSTSIITYSAQELASLAGEGRLYVLSKNAVGTLWDQILEFIMNIVNWIMSLIQ